MYTSNNDKKGKRRFLSARNFRQRRDISAQKKPLPYTTGEELNKKIPPALKALVIGHGSHLVFLVAPASRDLRE